MIEKTLPQLLIEKSQWMGNKVALREKDFGIWQEWTWSDYLKEVKYLALGLATMGFERGDKLAIIGDNRPEWVMSELAAQSLGGISVGLYQDALPKEIGYVLNHSDAKFVVVEDQEQVDKLLEIKEEIPYIQRIIFYDPKGMRKYTHSFLLDMKEVQRLGQQLNLDSPSFYEEQVQAGKIEDIAIFCYTSGTTGFPKGAMLTHQNLVNMGESLMSMDQVNTEEEFLSFLPLAWIGEQMMALSSSLVVGFTVNFPEEPTTVQENLREIGPHIIFSPPRIWEDMVSTIQVKIQDASWLKRKMYEWLSSYGVKKADENFGGESLSLWDNFLYVLGDYFVFSAMKDHLGLLRTKWAYTGGAALGPDVFRFFHSLGVNLKQIYGQTEVAGISIVHRDGQIKFNTVGLPIPGTEIKISDKGEILLKSPSVFSGYYKNDEATKETLENGWLRTGDAGYLDEDGHLIVIDRLKDVIRLTSGELFSPQFIENKLKFSPYIKEAVASGQDRPYVVAMINIDMNNVGRYAEVNQIPYTTYTDLSQKQEVLNLIRDEIEKINLDLPEKARIKKFVLLYKELDADDEELTRTRKVRRGFVAEKYLPVIEGLYEESEEIHVVGKIKYRDGKELEIKTNMKVIDMEKGVA